MNTRHITRFTYKFTNFQGWRVAITRQGVALARYFSDKQYGDAETAREQAFRFRDMVLAELTAHPEQTQAILMKHRVPPPGTEYPAGLKPAPTTTTELTESPACSMRSNKVLHSILRRVCKHLQLDTASVLKLSLYLFTLQYGAVSQAKEVPENTKIQICANKTAEESTATHLQSLVEELEQRARQAGLPSFEEFSTGRSSPPPLVMPNEQQERQRPPQNDDIATYDNSHAAERYMRSPRPSPPQTFTSSASLPPHTAPLPISQPAATNCHAPHTTEASLAASLNPSELAHNSTPQHFARTANKRRIPPSVSRRHHIPLL